MNQEKYLEQLMQRSKDCGCADLDELFEKRKTARDLESRCNFFKENADLQNPRHGDEQFLSDYQKEVSSLKKAVDDYYQSLYQYAGLGRLYFALHDIKKGKVVEFLPLNGAQRLLREYDPIISIHCNACSQQIDVAHR